MSAWRQIALWGVVVLLIFSFVVCQKKTKEAKTDKPPKETALSSAAEEEAKEPAEAITEVEEEQEEKPVAEEKPMEAAPAKEVAPENAVAVIELEKGGRIVFEFYPKDAPNTVDNFIKLTNEGFYSGLKFHRVMPGFMAQGGCPLGTGTGGPGYKIKAEFNSQKHLKGTVAMARAQHPDSAGSQFYICLEPQPSLDNKYTVFGQVIEGIDVVDGIKIGDVMKKVSIVDKASLGE